MTRVVLVTVVALAVAGAARAEPSRKEYLAHVSTVCTSYARRLERVPAPSDPAAYGNVISSLGRALPLLRAQERSMKAIGAPSALRPRLAHLFTLNHGSIADLELVLAAAKLRDAGGVTLGLARFIRDRERVHAASVALGIRCTTH